MSNQYYIINPILLLSILLATGCSSLNATRNSKLTPCEIPRSTKASFVITKDRGVAREKKIENQTLVILALSGGGSRAAYWSSEVMLNLAEVFKAEGPGYLDLLKEVDVISSVSGGSLPAAYYVISEDKDDIYGNVASERSWDRETVRDLMANDYITRWFYNWFWPSNIAQYWFTAFDRSDIMAQTFADNLFDVSMTGWDLKFKDINEDRPNIILNATNGTGTQFGDSFTFTDDTFHTKLNSQLSEYDIAWAVMATASFPAVFNYMTLEDFSVSSKYKYVHVFDGGNTDNLGLVSARKVINTNIEKYNKFVVILVDSYTKTSGLKKSTADARKLFDFVVDTNFLDSTDSLLKRARDGLIKDMEDYLERLGKKSVFYHIQFDDIEFKPRRDALHLIPTNFKIRKKNRRRLEYAASKLIVAENECLKLIKSVVLDNDKLGNTFKYCQWPARKVDKHIVESAVNIAHESRN